MQRDQARGGGHLGPVADPAQVARVPKGHDRHALAARLGDSQLHRGFAHHLAEAEPAVDHRNRVILEDGLERLIRDHLARAQPVDVAGYANDSVRVVPDQVGADQVVRDPLALGGFRTAGGEDRLDELFEPVVGDDHQALCHASNSWTTRPETSVSRMSRPP